MIFTVMLLAVSVMAQTKKVAVVTFYADKQVDLTNVGMGTVTIAADLAKDPTFNLQPLLDKFHNKFFNEYAKKFPFELVLPESTITESEAYKSFVPEYEKGYNGDRYVTSPGYKALNSSYGTANIKGMVKAFNEYDGVMFVYLTFEMDKGFGVGGTATTKMQAFTNIIVYNKKGDKVFAIREHANSKKTGMMVGGVPVMKADKVLPMCESALDELMEDLDKRVQKIIDKSAKKL